MGDNGQGHANGNRVELGHGGGTVLADPPSPANATLAAALVADLGAENPARDSASKTAPAIAGLSALKGLILYGATLSFAGLYAYFMVKIFGAGSGRQPKLDTAMVSAAAALAGVLGSAFALEIGTPASPSKTNPELGTALKQAETKPDRARARIRQLFSLEAGNTETASWPKTFGIWVYALVATAVVLTYVLNQTETPSAIKALAVAFGGYVIALINNAYNGSKQSGG